MPDVDESTISSELTPAVEEEPIAANIPLTRQSAVTKAKKVKAPKPEKTGKKGKDAKKFRPLPTEIVFLRYYTETYVIYNYIELSERILGPISKESLIDIPEVNVLHLQRMKQNLFAPVNDFIEDVTKYDIIKCLQKSPNLSAPIDEILHITPSYGYLNPFESQVLTISYHPNRNLSFRTKVACYVSGGITEFLHITGISSDINYYLETTKIDFGRQLFNDTCVKPLQIINTGVIPFSFNVVTSGFGSCYTTRLLELGWIEISPRNKILEPQEETYIVIKYSPGIAGRFEETFDIEVLTLFYSTAYMNVLLQINLLIL